MAARNTGFTTAPDVRRAPAERGSAALPAAASALSPAAGDLLATAGQAGPDGEAASLLRHSQDLLERLRRAVEARESA
jgi:hypothetical protein